MSQLDRIVELIKIMIERKLGTATPPQFMDPGIIREALNELTQDGIGDEELVIIALKELCAFTEGRISDEQMKIGIDWLLTNPGNPDAWCHLATLLKAKKDFNSAKNLFLVSLSLNPNHSDANFNFANLLREEGNLEEAEKYYRKCLEIDPKDFNARNNLGELLIRVNRFNDAEREIKKVMEIFPLHFKNYNNLGVLYAKQGDYDHAEESFRRAIDINPDYEKAKENLIAMLDLKRRQKVNKTDKNLFDFQVFGQAEVVEGAIKINSSPIDESLSVIGGVNIRLENLARYSNFSFVLKYEENMTAGILEMSYLDEKLSPSVVLPFPLVDNFGKMTISGALQPTAKPIDLNKVRIIQFSYRPIFPFPTNSPLIWIRDFRLW